MSIINNRNLPTNFSAVHFCPNCWRHFPSAPAAQKCFYTNDPLIHKPGDIVVIEINYGWWDGRKHWLIPEGRLSPNGHHLHPGEQMYKAYFVVTAANHVEHRARYHVKTLGIKNGNKTGLCGWTSDTHRHCEPVNRPDLAEEAKRFIGETYDHLI